jgi:uncharacterized protein (TIGR00304 family)
MQEDVIMKQEIGLLLIAIGFLLVLASLLQNFGQGSTSYSGVVLIGPIPIILGSSPQMAVVSMLMAAGLMILSYLLFRRL